MQDGSTLVSLRCEHRYQIQDSKATWVSVAVPTEDGEPQVHEGRLSDLSLSGVRLALPEKLLQGQQVTVRLTLPAIDVDVTREATVCWTEPRDGESWWVGCLLDESLDTETIDSLAAADVVDRRRDTRYPTSQLAQARWELSDDVLDVQVVNYSKGGFCMVCAEDMSCTSERVMLLVEENDRRVKIPARVMWHRPMEDGHAYGCSFTTRDGFVRLCELVEPGWRLRQRFRRGKTKSKHALTRWVIMAVAVLLTVEFMELVGVQPRLWQTVRGAFVSNVVQPIRSGVIRAWQGDSEDDSTQAGP